jgi:5-methylcytosine-specific restriction endonuclease McrA
MKKKIQLTLDKFGSSEDPLCHHRPALNVFRRLCIYCAYSRHYNHNLLCEKYGFYIGSREKYTLRKWKALRESILERDSRSCVLCGSATHLHVHHIDLDKTNDHPENLVTLCEGCHARVHTEVRRDGGEALVERIPPLNSARLLQGDN